MNYEEQNYLDLLSKLISKSKTTAPTLDRTGVGTWNLFHESLRFDLSKGFPLLTTKRMGLKSIIGELLWFLSGSTNADELEEKYGCTIWREWKDNNGELGKVYGHQWRNFGEGEKTEFEYYTSYGHERLFSECQEGFDQITWLINEIKTNPTSRRLYVTASNPQDKDEQALDTCHNYFQVFIEGGKINLYFQMRSTDSFLGLPYNIASYAVLAHLLALETGYEVGELVYSGVVVHLYKNHLEQVELQSSREAFKFPQLKINKKSFFEYELSDFELIDYKHHPTIKGEVAI